ncbi:multiprotein bridging factor aMBF1 [Sulfolobus acidocaldarius]|uniref:Conserved Archaeal HTH domain protein n=4 Tax=Sulfolobus acidocaldarius TaxID=2285 RepID=Q4JAZ0_SULAC|nr:multiprotein bridging factor aMBF1 [Sulfolobus acidocaldarius]AAY80039.1 conserved Archaeal HTH domain protein [Sulfolobus acidocaldarius DSM 639]AGE70610.1 HTH DNA-binding domain-containing protein [Sulfolobus acidocaldarius N8]AGE72883.1 HTH DNA-binding domain-containing protein [Sulfolobus acidocaldarius Ron12/I]ALU29037.1 XRE family transcriptional regulator [Sulfolobus acidocaldarius]ALU31763.1 XRE family transcriptional regulator [Sulfolobus acidocaldarius]
MQNQNVKYCELCGSPIKGKGFTVSYEGSIITVCTNCFNKIKNYAKIVNLKKEEDKKRIKTSPNKKYTEVELDIVEEYYKIIKEARERLKMSQQQLAQALKVSENIIKRFESGKLKPTIQQAKQLERILGIKLLVPIEGEEESNPQKDLGLTLGDIVNIREGKK